MGGWMARRVSQKWITCEGGNGRVKGAQGPITGNKGEVDSLLGLKGERGDVCLRIRNLQKMRRKKLWNF